MPGDLRPGFYFITDAGLTRQGAARDAGAAIRGGATVVQYREKSKPYGDMLAEAREVRDLCRAEKVPFVINDVPELAVELGADGLHLGPHDMPPAEARKLFPNGLLGISCGSLDDLKVAEDAGADYVAASPLFYTSTKSDIGRPLGLEGLRAFREATELPIVAIGGINLDNVTDVVKAGADLVCAISATVATDDVEASVRRFADIMKEAQRR